MKKATKIDEETFIGELAKLSPQKRKEAINFISYLRIKEEIEATSEILSDEDFLRSIMRGDDDFKKGKIKQWSDIREDV